MENKPAMKVNIGIITIVCLLVIQIIGVAFGYGMLTQQVSFNREIISQYQATQATIMVQLSDLSTRLTKIETMLGTR